METTAILTYYNQVLTLSGRLLAITESIMSLAQKGQVEQVAVGLGKRQDIIDQLKVIEKKIIEKKMTPSQRQSLQKDKDIQPCLTSIRKAIERVKLLDLEIRMCVDYEQKKVAGEVKKVSTNHALIKKYLPSRVNAPGYFSLSI